MCSQWLSAEKIAFRNSHEEEEDDSDKDTQFRDLLMKMVEKYRNTPCGAAALARLIEDVTEDWPDSEEEMLQLYGRYVEEYGDMDEEAAEILADRVRLPQYLKDGFPDLQMTDLRGNEISLEALKGKVVLLDFWATWCGPCVHEIPDLVSLYNRHRWKGFQIIGISLDYVENPLDRLKFRFWLVKEGIRWPQHLGGKGWQDPLVEKLNVNGIPETFLFNREGDLVAIGLRGKKLASRVKQLIASQKTND